MGSRSLTGARIETCAGHQRPVCRRVAPSRERGSKPALLLARHPAARVAPSRERGSKHAGGGRAVGHGGVAPSRERGSKHERNREIVGRQHVAPSRERGSKRLIVGGGVPDSDVAPSRERGSKPCRHLPAPHESTSLPHGSADRNMSCLLMSRVSVDVAPSRERGSKHFLVDRHAGAWAVAPSRERGSKRVIDALKNQTSRSLPHGSADRNPEMGRKTVIRRSRSLTGARVETSIFKAKRGGTRVAPSRERGSKHRREQPIGRRGVAPSRERGSKLLAILNCFRGGRSLPHGSADRNSRRTKVISPNSVSLPHGSADRNAAMDTTDVASGGRSLTGARIETSREAMASASRRVAPSRERGSKRAVARDRREAPLSLPHGSADRNHLSGDEVRVFPRRSLTGARIETRRLGLKAQVAASLPHGSADRNILL